MLWENGALGGKLLGAGGGGFFLFYVPPFEKNKLIAFLKSKDLTIQPFRFEPDGLKTWVSREHESLHWEEVEIMKISNTYVGEKQIFVIAEIGNNHNGDFQLALEMVDAACDFGADCVKFQMRNMSSVYRKKTLAKQGEDLGTEYILDLLERFQLSEDEHRELARYCKSKESLVYVHSLGLRQYCCFGGARC